MWIDRTEQEVRDQLAWEKKWGVAKGLYEDHSAAPSRYAAKPEPTRWALYSILNPPVCTPGTEDTGESSWASSSIMRRRTANERRRGAPATSAGKAAGRPAEEERAPTTPARGLYVSANGTSSSSSYHSDLHPHTHRRLHEQPPMQTYPFPATSAQRYGWTWGGRTTLEVFGPTSCNYRLLAAKRFADTT